MLQTYNDLAKGYQALEALQTEKKYFMQMYEASMVEMDQYEEIFSKLSLRRLLAFIAEL